jgi:hypothetical protein
MHCQPLIVLSLVLSGIFAAPTLLDFTVHFGEDGESGQMILREGDTPVDVST